MPRRRTKRGSERTALDSTHDVVICGASFAGLATARQLAGTGVRVLLLDRYEVGERQTSACAAPTAWLEALGLEASMRRAMVLFLDAASFVIACANPVGPEPIPPAGVHESPALSLDRVSAPMAPALSLRGVGDTRARHSLETGLLLPRRSKVLCNGISWESALGRQTAAFSAAIACSSRPVYLAQLRST